MNRLTDINKCIVNYKQSYTDEEISNIIVKLGKLEDLEDELGCPLEIVLNLIKNSNKLDEHYHTQDIWFEYEGQVIYGSFLRLGFEDNKFVFYVEANLPNSIYDIETTILYVKDYKKTWWLKEDKSE